MYSCSSGETYRIEQIVSFWFTECGASEILISGSPRRISDLIRLMFNADPAGLLKLGCGSVRSYLAGRGNT